MPRRVDGEPAFTDARGGLLLGFWVALGTAITGALWWNLARGSATQLHPGILGVVLTPLAVLVAVLYAVRLARARRPDG